MQYNVAILDVSEDLRYSNPEVVYIGDMNMMNFSHAEETIKELAHKLYSIDSPTGFTDRISDYLIRYTRELGYDAYRNRLGNVIVSVPGKGTDRNVALSAHVDTLGLMVRSITKEGYLMFTQVGSPVLPSLDGEYCRIYTRSGKVYTGTILSLSPAVHVFDDANTRPRDEKNMAVRLDEEVHSKEDVLSLGIQTGDFICYDSKTIFTDSGFLKSRFIDDKACAALELTLLTMIKYQNLTPSCTTYICFSTHEEIGYGGATLPSDLDELLVVDMGCVGDDLNCTEQQVSICAKDNLGPYDYEMTSRLINLSAEHGIDYAVDIYPHYGSDAGPMWRSGKDTKAALIGPGVHASHGMERTHLSGMTATLRLMAAYLNLL